MDNMFASNVLLRFMCYNVHDYDQNKQMIHGNIKWLLIFHKFP